MFGSVCLNSFTKYLSIYLAKINFTRLLAQVVTVHKGLDLRVHFSEQAEI